MGGSSGRQTKGLSEAGRVLLGVLEDVLRGCLKLVELCGHVSGR